MSRRCSNALTHYLITHGAVDLRLALFDPKQTWSCPRKSYGCLRLISLLLQVHKPFLSCPCHPSLFSSFISLVCVCVCVYACVHIYTRCLLLCVCMCVLCSQPLCGKQSLWRALAFHNQSLAPLHTPSPLPRIQTWTHTAAVSFLPLSQPHPFLISITAERFRSRRTSVCGAAYFSIGIFVHLQH